MDYHFLTYLRHSVVRARKQGLDLVTDVPPEQMLAQPAGLLHPTWLLGHINLYYTDVLTILRDEPFIDDAKTHPLFSPGTTPSMEASLYPGKTELLEAFVDGHDQVSLELEQATPALLDRPTSSRSLPTVGSFLIHLMIDHEWHHLGQLAAWRRAMGLP